MSSTAAGWLQFALLVVALAACYVPLGNYMARIFTDTKHWRVERGIYKLCGIDPEADMRWSVYVRSILAFSLVSVLFLYLLERTQHWLFLTAGLGNVTPDTAWNTAASFTTNTNWQNYSGESTMGYLTQMGGLAVQNFLSAAVGIVIAIALVRGFIRSRTDKLGNFWVDVTRITIRYLIPLAIVGGLILMASGVIDNFTSYHTVTTLSGAHQTIVGGPVASQEVIKDAGNNGGGFFNANSAHPFESPNPFTNWFEIFLLLLTAFSLPRTFGRMVKDNRQGYALLAVMVIIWLAAAGGISFFEAQHAGIAPQLAHGAMEGKNVAFGTPGSSLFAASTTVTSTGSVNSFHDSFTPFGGGIALFDIALGEVAPGGVGAGLYGILVLAIVTVFVAGLMVGRTPVHGDLRDHLPGDDVRHRPGCLPPPGQRLAGQLPRAGGRLEPALPGVREQQGQPAAAVLPAPPVRRGQRGGQDRLRLRPRIRPPRRTWARATRTWSPLSRHGRRRSPNSITSACPRFRRTRSPRRLPAWTLHLAAERRDPGRPGGSSQACQPGSDHGPGQAVHQGPHARFPRGAPGDRAHPEHRAGRALPGVPVTPMERGPARVGRPSLPCSAARRRLAASAGRQVRRVADGRPDRDGLGAAEQRDGQGIHLQRPPAADLLVQRDGSDAGHRDRRIRLRAGGQRGRGQTRQDLTADDAGGARHRVGARVIGAGRGHHRGVQRPQPEDPGDAEVSDVRGRAGRPRRVGDGTGADQAEAVDLGQRHRRGARIAGLAQRLYAAKQAGCPRRVGDVGWRRRGGGQRRRGEDAAGERQRGDSRDSAVQCPFHCHTTSFDRSQALAGPACSFP